MASAAFQVRQSLLRGGDGLRGGVPAILGRTGADSALAADSGTRLIALGRTATDTAQAVDVGTGIHEIVASASDTAQALDSARVTAWGKQVADSALAADSGSRVISVGVTASDTCVPPRPPYGYNSGALGHGFLGYQILGWGTTPTGPDVATWTFTRLRLGADNALAADAAKENVALVRGPTDNALAADSAAGAETISRTATDSAAPGAQLPGFLGFKLLGKGLLGGPSLTPPMDSATAAFSYARFASDNALAADAATENVALGRTGADNALAADAAAGSLSHAVFGYENVGGQVFQPSALGLGLLGEAMLGNGRLVIPQDTATRQVALVRSVADSALASDSAHPNQTLFLTASDNAFATDANVASGVNVRFAVDTTTPPPIQGYLGFGLLGLSLLGVGTYRRTTDSATFVLHHPLLIARYAHDWVPPLVSTLPATGVTGLAVLGWWPIGDGGPDITYAQMDAASATTGHIHGSETAYAIDQAVRFALRFCNDNAYAIDVCTRIVSTHITAVDNAYAIDVATFISHLLGLPGCVHAVLTLLSTVEGGIVAITDLDAALTLVSEMNGGVNTTASIEPEIEYVASVPGGLLLPKSTTATGADAIALGAATAKSSISATIEVLSSSLGAELDLASIEAELESLYAVAMFQPEDC